MEGGNTSVKSVEFVVKSQACCANISVHTRMFVLITVHNAIFHLKQKVGEFWFSCLPLLSDVCHNILISLAYSVNVYSEVNLFKILIYLYLFLYLYLILIFKPYAWFSET